jgi:hypothetical protein
LSLRQLRISVLSVPERRVLVSPEVLSTVSLLISCVSGLVTIYIWMILVF